MSSPENSETESPSPPSESPESEFYECQYCGEKFPHTREGALQKGQHINHLHRDRVKQEREVGLRPPKEAVPSEGETFDAEKALLQDMLPREFVAAYGEQGINKLRRARLSKLIGIAPDITGKVRTWVMENYDTDETAKRDPNALQALLEHSGVSVKTAQRITAIISGLDQELRSYLPPEQPYYPQFQPQFGGRPYYLNPRSSGDQSPYSRTWQQPYYPYSQAGYYPPPFPDPTISRQTGQSVTIQEVQKVIQAEFDKKGEKDKLTLLADGMTGVMDEMRELKQKMESGEIGGKKEEPWEKAFNATQDQIKKLQDLATEKEKAGRTSEEREEIKELQAQITKLSSDLVAKEQDRKMEMLKGELMGEMKELKGVMQNVSAGGRVVEGYKSDEFRLLGQGLEHAAKKEPVKVVIEGAERLLSPVAPPQKRVEQGTDLDSLLSPEMSVEK